MANNKLADKGPWAVRSKVWLEFDGKPVIGEGRLAILEAIESSGSIRAAARVTGVSYRRIRGAIRDMEQTIGCPLVLARRGGGKGGGAELTPEAHELIDRFKKHMQGLQETVDRRFRESFADFLGER